MTDAEQEVVWLQVQEELMPRAHEAGLDLSYSAEASVQDELARESFTDVTTVALSYLAMFVYIAVALSRAPPSPPAADGAPRGAPTLLERAVYSRAGLAAAGVCVVAASVLAALGLCSFLGVPATLIIMEVRPVAFGMHAAAELRACAGLPAGRTHPVRFAPHRRRTQRSFGYPSEWAL